MATACHSLYAFSFRSTQCMIRYLKCLINYVFLFFEIFRVFQGGRKEPPLCGQRLCLLAGGGGGWCGGGGVQILGYFWKKNYSVLVIKGTVNSNSPFIYFCKSFPHISNS